MNDKLAASNINLEREHFNNLSEIHIRFPVAKLIQNSMVLTAKGLSAERKQIP